MTDRGRARLRAAWESRSTVKWWVWLVLATMILFPRHAQPMQERTRTLACTVSYAGPEPDVVVANVTGMCGASCRESVRWTLWLEPRIVWDRGVDPESWLVVLRDQPMYAEASIRRNGVEIARCGERFRFDGQVHRLDTKDSGTTEQGQ